jgi:dTMP kinase
LKHLSEGTSVICDRYAYSGVAFTATKGLDLEWLKNPDRGLPRPDAVLYLDLSIEEAKKRGGYGEEVYEKEEVQRVVKSIYEDQLWEDEYWHRVPANETPERLHEELKALCTKIIASIPEDSKEPKLLWTQKL